MTMTDKSIRLDPEMVPGMIQAVASTIAHVIAAVPYRLGAEIVEGIRVSRSKSNVQLSKLTEPRERAAMKGQIAFYNEILEWLTSTELDGRSVARTSRIEDG